VRSKREDFAELISYIAVYFQIKICKLARLFEQFKNSVVELLMLRRGVMQKRFWHGSMIGLSAFGVITSGVVGNNTIVSSTFPGIGGQDPRFAQTIDPLTHDPVLESLQDTHTTISEKPRSEILEYEVKSGDTLSTIADKFNISQDTIKWANDLDGVTIKPGQKIKILPVSGVAVDVKKGDSLDSLAKKYDSSAQGILDFPFNDVPDDQSLKVGQLIIIPDGTPPQTAPSAPKNRPAPQFLAQGSNFNAPGGGSFIWPTSFAYISTYFAWWHPGIDLPSPAAPPVAAADGGVVTVAGWPDNYGYGNRVIIDHGNGYKTLYAHLSNIYVSVGQTVGRGQTIGQMGNTGRSTGTHLHFEIHYKNIAVNPLSILK
jgi:murein DD-endopeptidase MepM/ murein hydrolase activator NlpD